MGNLDWIYCLAYCSLLGCKKTQIFHRCQSTKTLQIKYWESPVLLLKKILTRCPSLHFHMDGKWPFLRQKSLSSVPSGRIPHWIYQRDGFQQDSWMTPFLGQPQTIRCLKPCLHRRLDGAHHFLFCLPRFYHQPSHISRTPHTPGLYCSPSIHTPHNTGPYKSLAVSLDDWKVLSIAFMKLMITILFAIN